MPLEQYENFYCPYCGGSNELQVDVSGGKTQEFVVDCEVCCAPIMIRLKISGGSVVSLDAQREND
jgi:hypothetical protein